ncbi:MAG: hypothetical protein AAFV33_08465, partial [Chloroflexota bacterium]
AALLADTGSTPEQIQTIRETRFPLQLQALEQPEAFAETILTSMESDLLLAADREPVPATTVDSLVVAHVAAATPVLLGSGARGRQPAGTRHRRILCRGSAVRRG